MIAMVVEAPTVDLEERLSRGVEFLFDMEQRGDLGPEYRRWLSAWLQLLDRYERQYAS